MARIGKHALVLGASMGGLMAARVLADHYETVTVVERDVLPAGPANRRGVPQGRHVHALIGRGCQVLGEFFPGFAADLTAAGAPSLDYTDLSETYMDFSGHLITRAGGLANVPPVLIPSRPLLEGYVRQRLRDTANVTFLEGCVVVDLVADPSGRRVTGARVRAQNVASTQVVEADLVVDATGRGSRTPAFLEAMGFGRPAEDTVHVQLVYSSQPLRLPPGTLSEKIVLSGPVPGRTKGVALFGYEDDMWIFTVLGMAGCEPPTEPVDMIAFAEGLVPPHILTALASAEPLGEVTRFRYPDSRWRRYDRMRRFPDGLLVLGDAMCSFNPVYGQGMTVAALQARSLAACLQRGTANLARRYFRAAAEPIGVAWQFAVGGDLALPEVDGRRTVATRLTNAYVDRVLAAAESDPVVAEQFIRVIGLVDPPALLVHPRMVLRTVLGGRHTPPEAPARVGWTSNTGALRTGG